MRQLTIAIAGAGSRAAQHLDTLALLGDHYRVVAISDPRADRVANAAARFRAAAFEDPVRMLDEARPDALFIVVPPDGHHPLTIAAAERGIHVLSEVPISITLPLADRMIDAGRRAGVVLEICENVPRLPKERLKREVIQQGLLGEILLARLQYASGAYHGISAVRRLLPGRATRVWGFRRTLPALSPVEFSGLVQDTQDWEFGFFSFGEVAEGSGAEPTEVARLLYEQPPRPGARNSWEVVGTRGRMTDLVINLLQDQPDDKRREVSYPISYETAPRPGGGETLLRALIATDPPVIWENPHAHLGLPAGPDDVA
ncbi:MAG TPA: Gfo/Idh/MocA family oxidoreductase, partial [Chloroflexota bacterium]|nr:Gfo/Idh/MocA family oxidoreductase [Chloroflexota bacterium]